MTVLTEEELENLLKVPTTFEQAKLIKQRNEWALEQLERLEKNWNAEFSEEIDLGCPHCTFVGGSHNCDACHWRKYPGDYYMRCASASFGGIKLSDVDLVDYGCFTVSVYADGRDEDEIEDAKTFVTGHIEWAEEVIKRGGTE